MATVAAFLLGIARDLNDVEPGHEFSRWSREQLIDYLNEGSIVAAFFKPDAYTTTKIVKLEPGIEQSACSCSYVTKVIGQTDSLGNLLYGPLPERTPLHKFGWTMKPCISSDEDKANKKFRLSGYWLDNIGDSSFSVSPSVPLAPPVYVKLRCVETPEEIPYSGNGTLPEGTVQPALRQWVLYRAMMVDDESATASTAAIHHLQTFFQLLQIQFTRETISKMGGTNNPAVKSVLSTMRAAGMIGGRV